MTLGDFMDVLGRLHKLTPAQRRAVAEVLAEPEEVQRPEEPSEPVAEHWCATMDRKPYSESCKYAIANAAHNFGVQTAAQQEATVKALARRFGRTEKAIRYQITSRLKWYHTTRN